MQIQQKTKFHSPITITTSMACWYKLNADSDNSESIIFAALSNALAAASSVPSCNWHKRHW